MHIENLRFIILSQKDSEPEKAPQAGNKIQLTIENDKNGRQTTTIVTETVEPLGDFYTAVSGNTKLNELEAEMYCIAKYDTSRVYPKDTPIGNLVVKKVTR